LTELAEELLLAIAVDEADGRRVATFIDCGLAVEISAAEVELTARVFDRAACAGRVGIARALEAEILERLRRAEISAFIASGRNIFGKCRLLNGKWR